VHMGKVQDVGAAVAAAAIGLAVAAVPVVLFLHDVRAGYSPSKALWIIVGFELFAAGILAVRGLGALIHADGDEDRMTSVSTVVAIVVTASGLLAARHWVQAYEPPVVSALGPACRGTGVAEAPKAADPRRVVVLDDQGHKLDWTPQPADWRAEDVAEADLVACVDRQDLSLELCRYRGVPAGPGREIERFQQVVTVRMVEARTAREIGAFTLTDDARECREFETEGQGDLHGHVGFAAFSTSVAEFLAE